MLILSSTGNTFITFLTTRARSTSMSSWESPKKCNHTPGRMMKQDSTRFERRARELTEAPEETEETDQRAGEEEEAEGESK